MSDKKTPKLVSVPLDAGAQEPIPTGGSASASGSIRIASDVTSFFEDQVVAIARKQGVSVSPHAQKYLASVLSKFTDAKNYLVRAEKAGKPGEAQQSYPTLALLFMESHQSPGADQFFKLLHLGDVALFTSGFFGERVMRSAVDMDYYHAMGHMAYERAGHIKESLAAERAINIYFELASSFRSFSEIFAEMSDQSLLGNDEGLIRLYEKWLARGSFRLARMLNEVGVIAGTGSNDGSGAAD